MIHLWYLNIYIWIKEKVSRNSSQEEPQVHVYTLWFWKGIFINIGILIWRNIGMLLDDRQMVNNVFLSLQFKALKYVFPNTTIKILTCCSKLPLRHLYGFWGRSCQPQVQSVPPHHHHIHLSRRKHLGRKRPMKYPLCLTLRLILLWIFAWLWQ